MNLIRDAWIPVRLQDGSQIMIRPAQIAVRDNPPVALDAPRADFNGALAQLLIGLLQTAFAPGNDEEWEYRLEQPPTVDILDQAFTRYDFAFEVDGDGPRFMQDFEAFEKTLEPRQLKNATKPIEWLLIDAPTENTLKNNADHFIKRGRVGALCPICAVTALFTLQINAPSGGRGYRTSVRGGGPLTTLVALDPDGSGLSDTLWHQLWLNILPETVSLTSNPDLTKPEYIFPWLAPTRTSEKGSSTTPEDASPLQMYWCMPRRIRLNFEHVIEGYCGLCNRKDNRLLSHYLTLNYGIDYTGAWRHPLSPYREQTNKAPTSESARPGGVTYRHWLGLVYPETDDKQSVTPAIVVRKFLNDRLIEGEQFRLWAFGYDIVPGQDKARCWYEATLPLYQVPEDIREDFALRVGQLIKAAEYIAGLLKSRIKEAWFKRPKDVRGDVGFLADAFYHHTESAFYACLPRLMESLPGSRDREVLGAWRQVLVDAAIRLFDNWVASEDLAFADPGRVALARNNLRKQLYGPKLKKILSLPQSKEKTA